MLSVLWDAFLSLVKLAQDSELFQIEVEKSCKMTESMLWNIKKIHSFQKNTTGNVFESLIDSAFGQGLKISWADDLDKKYGPIWVRLFSDSCKRSN